MAGEHRVWITTALPEGAPKGAYGTSAIPRKEGTNEWTDQR